MNIWCTWTSSTAAGLLAVAATAAGDGAWGRLPARKTLLARLQRNSYPVGLQSWTLTKAVAVNDQGMILANGTLGGAQRGCIIIPLEPTGTVP
jgi:hypothetical protein